METALLTPDVEIQTTQPHSHEIHVVQSKLPQCHEKHQTTSAKSTISALTGYRGLLCLMIFAHHMQGYKLPFTGDNFTTVFNPIFWGWAHTALLAFFQLSGFLMEHTTSQCSFSHWQCYKSFYLKRIFRIAPVFYFALFWSMHDLSCFYNNTCPTDKQLASVILTPFFLRAWIPTNPAGVFLWLGVSWTLSIEMTFYAVFPFTSQLLRKLSRKQLWIAAALCQAASSPIIIIDCFSLGVDHYNFWAWTPSRFPEFIMGQIVCLLAAGASPQQVLPLSRVKELLRITYNSIPFLIVFYTRTLLYYYDNIFDMSITGPPFNGFVAWWLFSMVRGKQDFATIIFDIKWKFLRIFEFYGTISYCFYMLHQIIVYTYGTYVQSNQVWIYWLGMCTIVAYTVHTKLEEPVYKWCVARFLPR